MRPSLRHHPDADAIEAASLSYNSQYIDIYSNSWGFDNGGTLVGGPLELTTKAIMYGVNEGRGGKGSIYVFAAGNGGINDNCNCDGYVNSVYTISVAAVNEDGFGEEFSEPCSAILTTAFGDKITTTDSGTGDGQCRNNFNGTSAAAPMVSSIIALALEVNPSLTWRDVQHISKLLTLQNMFEKCKKNLF